MAPFSPLPACTWHGCHLKRHELNQGVNFWLYICGILQHRFPPCPRPLPPAHLQCNQRRLRRQHRALPALPFVSFPLPLVSPLVPPLGPASCRLPMHTKAWEGTRRNTLIHFSLAQYVRSRETHTISMKSWSHSPSSL